MLNNPFRDLKLDNQKIILILVFCVIAAILDYNFLLKNQILSVNKIGPDIEKKTKELVVLEQNLVKMRQAKEKQVKEMQSAQKSMKEPVSEAGVLALLENVSELCNKHKVEVLSLKPYKEPPLPAPKQEKGKPAVPPTPESRFTRLSISLELSCNYHDLGKLISELESGKALISVQSVKISADQKDLNAQKVMLVLMAYLKK